MSDEKKRKPVPLAWYVCRRAVREGKARGLGRHPIVRLLERSLDLFDLSAEDDVPDELSRELDALCAEAIESLEED